jgi:hypothetical protein
MFSYQLALIVPPAEAVAVTEPLPAGLLIVKLHELGHGLLGVAMVPLLALMVIVVDWETLTVTVLLAPAAAVLTLVITPGPQTLGCRVQTTWLKTLPTVGPRISKMAMTTIATRTKIKAYSTNPCPFSFVGGGNLKTLLNILPCVYCCQSDLPTAHFSFLK